MNKFAKKLGGDISTLIISSIIFFMVIPRYYRFQLRFLLADIPTIPQRLRYLWETRPREDFLFFLAALVLFLIMVISALMAVYHLIRLIIYNSSGASREPVRQKYNSVTGRYTPSGTASRGGNASRSARGRTGPGAVDPRYANDKYIAQLDRYLESSLITREEYFEMRRRYERQQH